MFEYLHSHFLVPGFFRLFGYVTFRALLAAIVSMSLSFMFGEIFIRKLQKLSLKENIRSDGPNSHHKKAGTPTMGGLMILFTLLISCLLFGNFSNLHFVLVLTCTLLFGLIGFWDDYEKTVIKNKKGMLAKVKILLTLGVATAFVLIYYIYTPNPKIIPNGINYSLNGIFIPFMKGEVWVAPLIFSLIFWVIVIVGSSHAVNLTDGLDGLAIGNVSIVAVTMGVITYLTGTPMAAKYLNIPLVEGSHELCVFLAALTGAGIGFLWFNASPAKVFMGDTGSLALGSALGMTAIIIKKEFLLAIVGGIFVLEAVSVILQVASFKLRGKRIFKMAPLHHHFELIGWPETRVVIRFWLIGVILSLIAFSTLRVQ